MTTNNWRTWSVLQDWTTTTSFAWTPAAGNYTIAAWVRSAGKPADAPEGGVGQVRQMAFTITP